MTTFTLHYESGEYLASLRFRDRSVNTERVYAGRLALFLTYCAEHRLDWRCVTVDDLARFQRWLVTEPMQCRGRHTARCRPGPAGPRLTRLDVGLLSSI